MTKRRRAAVLLVAAGAVVGVTAVAAVEAGSRRPAVAFAEGVPSDLEQLVRATWERFTDAIPGRWDCLAPVTVSGAWELDDRASYDPDRGLVVVRIPGTAPNLQASLVHEFAHHLEFTCPEQRSLRSDFLAAQGLPGDTPWFDGATWEQTPSEQYAEGMVEVVLGRAPPPPRIAVTAAAVETIRAWGRST
jgi:hypothetical protein